MSDMKCPFCKEEIISDLCFLYDKKTRDYINGTQIYKCNKCGLFGTKALWQELIRTRKALDVAVDALKKLEEKAYLTEYAQGVIAKALKEITALEQKDVK